MLVLPEINTRVTIDVPGWAVPLKSRIEDIGDELLVADPLVVGCEPEPSIGTPIVICWTGVAGPMEMLASLVSKEVLGILPLWRLRPRGGVVITQRRHHVRVSGLLPLMLTTAHGHIDGYLVDVSDGGFGLVCRKPAPLREGDPLTAAMVLEGQPMSARAEVMRVETDEEFVRSGCRFVGLARQETDLVRRFLRARQLRERELWS